MVLQPGHDKNTLKFDVSNIVWTFSEANLDNEPMLCGTFVCLSSNIWLNKGDRNAS